MTLTSIVFVMYQIFIMDSKEKRVLGDEWLDWDGRDNNKINAGKGLYLAYVISVFLVSDVVILLSTYLITPRLYMWSNSFPMGAWIGAVSYVIISILVLLLLTVTAIYERSFLPFPRLVKVAFGLSFGSAFRLASIMKISKDKLGNSFVKVSNAITKSMQKPIEKKLLILLPRCIGKEQIDKIKEFNNKYPVEVAVVSGGEQARKKVREIRPTAVIGVACERDLVAGIKDISTKVSVIGVPNERPEGPCKNTFVDIEEVRKAIEFFIND